MTRTKITYIDMETPGEDVGKAFISDGNDAVMLSGVATDFHDHDSDYSLLGHDHVETDITDLDHDAVELQGRTLASTAPNDGESIAWNDGASQWEPTLISGGGGTDTKEVKVSSNDTTAAFLEDKLQAGTNITLNILNEGANEKVEIVASGGGNGGDVEVNIIQVETYT